LPGEQHSALAENLLPNPADEGRIRQHAVDIGKSLQALIVEELRRLHIGVLAYTTWKSVQLGKNA